MRNKREKLKTEISNLASAIAEGHRSAALLDQLGKRERELDDISEELSLMVNGFFGQVRVWAARLL